MAQTVKVYADAKRLAQLNKIVRNVVRGHADYSALATEAEQDSPTARRAFRVCA